MLASHHREPSDARQEDYGTEIIQSLARWLSQSLAVSIAGSLIR